MTSKMLDLCAGFGGQSEAFLRGGWQVLRIDNNPLLSEVEEMVIMDLFDPSFDDVWAAKEKIEYVHAADLSFEDLLMFSGRI